MSIFKDSGNFKVKKSKAFGQTSAITFLYFILVQKPSYYIKKPFLPRAWTGEALAPDNISHIPLSLPLCHFHSHHSCRRHLPEVGEKTSAKYNASSRQMFFRYFLFPFSEENRLICFFSEEARKQVGNRIIPIIAQTHFRIRFAQK